MDGAALPGLSAESWAEEGRAAIGVRGVSQVARSGQAAQRRAIAAVCRRHGWLPLDRLEQADAGAAERRRPGLAAAQQSLEHNHALLAAKQDTLPRLLLDLAALLASAQTQGWALVALDCAPDPARPAGDANPNLVAAFAPFEQRLISQRTRQALARSRAQGVRLGRPPTIAPHLIKRIQRERAAGRSLAAIANGLNADRIPTAQGGRRWYPATIRYTLNRTH